jgi:RNA polymerase sigma-70 factor, ECF subfamily
MKSVAVPQAVARLNNGSDPGETGLLARARRGEPDAIGSLYDRYSPGIFRYLWYRLGDRCQAEDLTGEVFMRMLKSISGYRSQGSPFRAWLYRIAHNLLVDAFRSERAAQEVSLEEAGELEGTGLPPSQQVERNLTLDTVRKSLENLAQPQREVVILRFIDDLSIAETALVLGKTEAAVKALQHRGLAALQAALAHVHKEVVL